MAQGWIGGYMFSGGGNALMQKEAIEKLPKCLKEDCALWIEEDGMGREGYCGLINSGVPRKRR